MALGRSGSAMTVSVSVEPSSLGYSELFQLAGAMRYPRSALPARTWMIRESLFLTLFGTGCTFVVFAVYPEFSPVRTTLLVVPLLLVAWGAYLVLGFQTSYREYQSAESFVVELSEFGPSWHSRGSESRVRWKPGFEIVSTSHWVIIRCGKPMTLCIPSHSFASPEDKKEFVRVGRLLQANATGKTIPEMKGSALEEV
jgi:hypothetical protein